MPTPEKPRPPLSTNNGTTPAPAGAQQQQGTPTSSSRMEWQITARESLDGCENEACLRCYAEYNKFKNKLKQLLAEVKQLKDTIEQLNAEKQKQIDEKQKQIDENQKLLAKNQKQIDENQKLNRAYNDAEKETVELRKQLHEKQLQIDALLEMEKNKKAHQMEDKAVQAGFGGITSTYIEFSGENSGSSNDRGSNEQQRNVAGKVKDVLVDRNGTVPPVAPTPTQNEPTALPAATSTPSPVPAAAAGVKRNSQGQPIIDGVSGASAGLASAAAAAGGSNSNAQNASSSSADNSALRALQGMDITALLQKNQRMATLRAGLLAGPPSKMCSRGSFSPRREAQTVQPKRQQNLAPNNSGKQRGSSIGTVHGISQREERDNSKSQNANIGQQQKPAAAKRANESSNTNGSSSSSALNFSSAATADGEGPPPAKQRKNMQTTGQTCGEVQAVHQQKQQQEVQAVHQQKQLQEVQAVHQQKQQQEVQAVHQQKQQQEVQAVQQKQQQQQQQTLASKRGKQQSAEPSRGISRRIYDVRNGGVTKKAVQLQPGTSAAAKQKQPAAGSTVVDDLLEGEYGHGVFGTSIGGTNISQMLEAERQKMQQSSRNNSRNSSRNGAVRGGGGGGADNQQQVGHRQQQQNGAQQQQQAKVGTGTENARTVQQRQTSKPPLAQQQKVNISEVGGQQVQPVQQQPVGGSGSGGGAGALPLPSAAEANGTKDVNGTKDGGHRQQQKLAQQQTAPEKEKTTAIDGNADSGDHQIVARKEGAKVGHRQQQRQWPPQPLAAQKEVAASGGGGGGVEAEVGQQQAAKQRQGGAGTNSGGGAAVEAEVGQQQIGQQQIEQQQQQQKKTAEQQQQQEVAHNQQEQEVAHNRQKEVAHNRPRNNNNNVDNNSVEGSQSRISEEVQSSQELQKQKLAQKLVQQQNSSANAMVSSQKADGGNVSSRGILVGIGSGGTVDAMAGKPQEECLVAAKTGADNDVGFTSGNKVDDDKVEPPSNKCNWSIHKILHSNQLQQQPSSKQNMAEGKKANVVLAIGNNKEDSSSNNLPPPLLPPPKPIGTGTPIGIGTEFIRDENLAPAAENGQQQQGKETTKETKTTKQTASSLTKPCPSASSAIEGSQAEDGVQELLHDSGIGLLEIADESSNLSQEEDARIMDNLNQLLQPFLQFLTEESRGSITCGLVTTDQVINTFLRDTPAKLPGMDANQARMVASQWLKQKAIEFLAQAMSAQQAPSNRKIG